MIFIHDLVYIYAQHYVAKQDQNRAKIYERQPYMSLTIE